jgi:hypothetical protein
MVIFWTLQFPNVSGILIINFPTQKLLIKMYVFLIIIHHLLIVTLEVVVNYLLLNLVVITEGVSKLF